MNQFLLLLLLLPLTTLAQKNTESFGKFINTDGSLIKGTSMVKGYERQIEAHSLISNSSTNSTVLRFAMPISGATGTLRSFINAKQRLPKAEIVVTYLSTDRRLLQYKIYMENIAVEECTDADGFTTIQLNATRIGWTYYNDLSRSSTQTIASKTGWNAETNTSWTNF